MTRSQTAASFQNMFSQSAAVLSRPSVATFERFERAGTTRDAFMYVALAALVSAVIAGFFGIFHSGVNPLNQFVVRLIGTLIGFGAFTGLVYVIGRNLFKGTGTYPEVAYTFALFYVPIAIAATVIGIIPILGWLVSFVLGLINVYFGYLAVQSSMNIRDQAGAIVTLVLSGVGLVIVNALVYSL
ncbi:YIP1 family protein [Deinococcus sonorensis]|uniref:YIP1 family protein n=2 Tax=Deinococcus sonorensis TaxID=309891 RepID=A0AAU7U792_9DEIO